MDLTTIDTQFVQHIETALEYCECIGVGIYETFVVTLGADRVTSLQSICMGRDVVHQHSRYYVH